MLTLLSAVQDVHRNKQRKDGIDYMVNAIFLFRVTESLEKFSYHHSFARNYPI